MRRDTFIVPLVLATMFLSGCATSSEERTVYVPASYNGTLAAGDPLGMQLMRRGGAIDQASVPYSRRMPAQDFEVAMDVPVIAAPQGGFVTMVSGYPMHARAKESNIRMPIATFAATDGPSAD